MTFKIKAVQDEIYRLIL